MALKEHREEDERDGCVVQLEEYLLSMCEALGSISSSIVTKTSQNRL
jgi:hypothetical protein